MTDLELIHLLLNFHGSVDVKRRQIVSISCIGFEGTQRIIIDYLLSKKSKRKHGISESIEKWRNCFLKKF